VLFDLDIDNNHNKFPSCRKVGKVFTLSAALLQKFFCAKQSAKRVNRNSPKTFVTSIKLAATSNWLFGFRVFLFTLWFSEVKTLENRQQKRKIVKNKIMPKRNH